jgi:hypothetical protein
MTVHREQGAKSRGQGLAEFALILPLVLFTIFVMIETARLLHAWISVENGARFGVRYAVTGEYDFGWCTSLYGGPCDTQAKQDGARLPSIRDATNSGSVGLLKDPLASVGTPGFFKITICSNKPGLIYFPSDSNTSTPADCQPLEDGGGPGDRVIVTVDFDHPLIAPILSSTWPKIHLTAKREGIVEQFRVARVVGLPATISIPTFTATVTSTATITTTPTPSLTPTPTPDCSLISVESAVLNGDYFDVVVHNGNATNVSLTGAWLQWYKYFPGQNFYGAEFAGDLYRNGPSLPTSPSLANPIVAIPMVAGGTELWRASFVGVGGGGLVGEFTALLTFDGVCTVTAVSDDDGHADPHVDADGDDDGDDDVDADHDHDPDADADAGLQPVDAVHDRLHEQSAQRRNDARPQLESIRPLPDRLEPDMDGGAGLVSQPAPVARLELLDRQ